MLDELRQDHRATISIAEAARLLGLPERTVYRCAVRGDIPTLRLGRRWAVPRLALLRVLGAHAVDDSKATRDVDEASDAGVL